MLAPGGHIVVYAPNRLYPFETHGFFFAGKYHGPCNLPILANWVPTSCATTLRRTCGSIPSREVRALFDGLDVEFVVAVAHFPGLRQLGRARPDGPPVPRRHAPGRELAIAALWDLALLRGSEARLTSTSCKHEQRARQARPGTVRPLPVRAAPPARRPPPAVPRHQHRAATCRPMASAVCATPNGSAMWRSAIGKIGASTSPITASASRRQHVQPDQPVPTIADQHARAQQAVDVRRG